MIRIRAIEVIPAVALLASMAGLGALFMFLVQQLGVLQGSAVLLVFPCLFVVFVLALTQAARNLAALGNNLAWWQGLILLLFLSELVFRIRPTQVARDTPVDGWAIYRMVLVATVGFVLAMRLTLKRTMWIGSLFQGLLGTLAVYALVAVASTSWSVYPSWTLYKSLEYFVDVALIAAILSTGGSSEKYKTLFNWTWSLYGLLLASVWVGVLLWPGEAFRPDPFAEDLGVRLQGVLPALSANLVGEYAAILAVVALSRLVLTTSTWSNLASYIFLFAMSLLMLILSYTRSAIVGLALGGALVLLFSRRKVLKTLTAVIALLLSLSGFARVFWTYFLRGQSPELFRSLTGRVDWWEFAWESFLKRPYTGFGAYTATFQVLPAMGETVVSQMHNAFVEILVGTSIWGLLPILIALVGTWYLLIRCIRSSKSQPLERNLAIEALGVLGVVTVRSFFNAHLVWHSSLQFLVLLGYAEFLRRQQEHETTVVGSLAASRRGGPLVRTIENINP